MGGSIPIGDVANTPHRIVHKNGRKTGMRNTGLLYGKQRSARRVRVLTIGKTDKIYQAIKRAAENGLPCPTNDRLAELAGSVSPSFAVERIKTLAKRNLITVERFQSSRIITIVETGKSTAGERGTPHWRDKKAKAQKPKKEPPKPRALKRNAAEPRSVPINPALIVDREPCLKCGVRRDIGCKHILENPHQRSITSRTI